MERRGNDFFDETLRIGRIFDLLSHHKLKRAFEQEVVGDLPRVVERQVEQVVEWMVDSDLRQWRAIAEHLERRRREHADRIVGQLQRRASSTTARGCSTKRGAPPSARSRATTATRSRTGWPTRCGWRWRAQPRCRWARSVSARIVTMLASTAAVDVTGILAAGALSALGLLVLPARRSGAKTELRAKVEAMRTRLLAALDPQFDEERARQPATPPGGDRALHALRPLGARAAGHRGGGPAPGSATGSGESERRGRRPDAPEQDVITFPTVCPLDQDCMSIDKRRSPRIVKRVPLHVDLGVGEAAGRLLRRHQPARGAGRRGRGVPGRYDPDAGDTCSTA